MHGRVQYSTADAPHQRGVMEAFTDRSVQTVVLCGASQVFGKTEIFNNVMGYAMDFEPRDIIMLRPTQESAEKYSKKKFMPMVRATPCLDSILPNSRSRDSGNTILVKEYTGGSIFFISANSTANLRGATGDVLLADEIDDNPASAGEEGDPVDLLFKRAEQFSGAIQAVASTPTVLKLDANGEQAPDSSPIWKWLHASDFQLWFVPCCHCGTWGVFKWSPKSLLPPVASFFFEWPKGQPENAALVCGTCAKELNDKQRLDGYYAGEWRGTQPFSGIRGFHLNWLYTPWMAKKGYINRLHQMAVEWERAKEKGWESLKVIINTGITEPTRERVENVPDREGLMARCEDYPAEVPNGVCYLTCSTDTQSKWLEYEIQGWGIGEECWGIETGKHYGNPHTSEPWEKLAKTLARIFTHQCGAKMRISCALIDSGGQMDAEAFAKPVYAFVLPLQNSFVFASKGSSTIGAPLVTGSPQKTGILLQLIGTDVCKSTIYQRLALQTPGPGYCHFPKDPAKGYGEEYFRQLTSEGVSLQGRKRVWVKLRDRNEALDLRVMGHAALAIRNVNLEAVAQTIKPPADDAPKAPHKPFRMRVRI